MERQLIFLTVYRLSKHLAFEPVTVRASNVICVCESLSLRIPGRQNVRACCAPYPRGRCLRFCSQALAEPLALGFTPYAVPCLMLRVAPRLTPDQRH